MANRFLNSRTGAIPSAFDGRDWLFETNDLSGSNEDALTVEISNPWDVPDQKNIPCCVSMAIVSAMEALDQLSPPAEQLSPLFHYYTCRNGNSDLSDLSLHLGLKKAIRPGICPLIHHNPPYSISGARRRPSPNAFDAARSRGIDGFNPITHRFGYRRMPDPSDAERWCLALRRGQPIVFGFYLSSAYRPIWDGHSDTHGHVNGIPSNGILHAVAALGYDQGRSAIKIRDSRGPSIGDFGYWWLPYQVLRVPGFIQEVFVIEKITY
ncbi:MAG: hypothetical protein QNK37_16520 [Acidobacteriota bacterium]|nr:hypothetical protein [Acidobacteriota bacterium]